MSAPSVVPSPTNHQVIALCASLVTLPLLHLALSTDRWLVLAGAVLVGVLVGAALGVALCRPHLTRGLTEGIAAVTTFWAISLPAAWLLGSGASPLTLSLLVGVPAAAVTAAASALLWGSDPMTDVIVSSVVTAVVVLPLVAWIAGLNLVHEREVAHDEARVAADLESAGLRPWLPELDGFTRDDDQRTAGSFAGDPSYTLDYHPDDADESDSRRLVVRVSPADPEGLCPASRPQCEVEEGYAVDGTRERRVVVQRGGGRLEVDLADAVGLSEREVAGALLDAELSDWHTVLNLKRAE
ncbi:hypothetical protein KG112_16165 [Nocardioides sp. zg-ZUI104]|uniref:hypothetical protein n=1 Tax=Nocardioides faecalis TaxID=2803858 RepID=UPI001BCAE983|nr:hypothetical protein [Nocardioides faecalis]MBS4754344.1 hypothetical protein [Nocardioides faecalis]